MVAITAPTKRQLDDLVQPYLENQPTGLAFAIGYASPQIAGGGGIHLSGNLVDQFQQPMALGHDTLFEIASVSKTFTATLYAYLLGSYGNPDPTLGDFFADARRHRIGSQFYGIGIAELLNYTSGLPADNDVAFGPPHWPQPYTVPGMCGFLDMTTYQPAGTGTAYSYSNLGFALAAAVAQRMAGQEDASFVELMHKYVFKPLGMTETTYFGRTDIARLPLGYTYSSQTAYAPARPGWPGFPAYNGAGGVVSTPADMQTWLRYNMGIAQNGALTPLLPALQLPTTTVTTKHGAQLGLGWFLSPADAASPVVWKDGEIAGCNSYVLFLQSDAPGSVASEAGVFVLTNASGLKTDKGGEIVAALAQDVLALMQGQDVGAEGPVWQRLVGRLPDL